MNGGWSILAEAFAHCPPGGHDPARGAPLPAFRPVKIPIKKKSRFTFQIILETASFRRFVGNPFRALLNHNFKLPPPHRNIYYPRCPGGGWQSCDAPPGQEWRLRYFASAGAKRNFYRESLDALLRALALSESGT